MTTFFRFACVAFASCVLFSGCGGGSASSKLIGKWEANLGAGDADTKDNPLAGLAAAMKVEIEFKKDGKMISSMMGMPGQEGEWSITKESGNTATLKTIMPGVDIGDLKLPSGDEDDKADKKEPTKKEPAKKTTEVQITFDGNDKFTGDEKGQKMTFTRVKK